MTPRRITRHEAEVLRRALEICPAGPVAQDLLDSISNLEVVARCECGCDTVEFGRIDWAGPPELVAEGVAQTADGMAVGLLVFGTADAVTCLEVYSLDDEPARLPTVESIRPYQPPSSDTCD
jgi:hypothetical protein